MNGNLTGVIDLSPEAPRGLASLPRICNTDDSKLLENIAANMARGLPEFQTALVHNTGEIAIVGSGPSVERHIEDIRAEKQRGIPVVAVKGAHDWLLERGVTPDLCVMIDAQAERVSCVQRRTAEVGYLMASQVSPVVLDWLTADPAVQVVLWHAWAGIGEDDILGPQKVKVGGGSTSGLRAIALAYLMGFRRVILYGFDSCLEGNVKRVNGDIAENVMPMYVGPDNEHRKSFLCNGAMAAQAQEFQSNFKMLPGLKVRVVGGGVLAAIMDERARLGHNDIF